MTSTITSVNIQKYLLRLSDTVHFSSLDTPSRSSESPSSPEVKTTTDFVYIETSVLRNVTDGGFGAFKLGAENMGLGLQPRRARAAL